MYTAELTSSQKPLRPERWPKLRRPMQAMFAHIAVPLRSASTATVAFMSTQSLQGRQVSETQHRKTRSAFVTYTFKPPSLHLSQPAHHGCQIPLTTSVSPTWHAGPRRTQQPLRSHRALQWSRNHNDQGTRLRCDGESMRGQPLDLPSDSLLGIIDLFFRRKKSVVGRPRGRTSVLGIVGSDCLHLDHEVQWENAGFDIMLCVEGN
jgi:hypothetical protein